MSEHVAGGDLGRLAEALDECERMQRKAKAEQRRRMIADDKVLRDEVRRIGAIVRDLTALVLLVDGCKQKRRQWRRDSMAQKVNLKLSSSKDEMGLTATELNALLDRIDSGNPTKTDREALAKCLHAVPNFAALLGDMSARVVETMLDRMNTQPTTRQAAGVHFLNMRDNLGYDEANALEKTLILNIVTCWFRLQYTELQFNLHTFGQHDPRSAKYWDSRLSASQRRYLRAVESLARVRKLLRPDSQTLVAIQNNVNVG